MELGATPMLVDPGPESFGLDACVRRLESLGIEGVDLLGHSYGSLVALSFAAAHPERVGRLVLVATAARLREDQATATQAQLAALAGEPWFADALAAAQRVTTGDYRSDAELGELFARQLPFYFARYGEREAAYAARMAELPMSGAAFRHFEASERRSFDLRPPAGDSHGPALVVVGESDPVLGPVSAREVVDGLPDARLEIIEDAGHFPWVEQPERFERVVREFLADG